MTIWRLVLQEIRYRTSNFLLSMASILTATAALVAAALSLGIQNERINELAARKQAETEAVMRGYEDDTRKAMLKLGFNVLIVHQNEERQKLLTGQAPAYTLPESYVATLAGSAETSDKQAAKGVVNLNHLLPFLRENLLWENRQGVRELAANLVAINCAQNAAAPLASAFAIARPRTLAMPIILTGTPGEIPIIGRTEKKPLIPVVAKGEMLIGHEIQRVFGLKAGDAAEMTLVREARYGNEIVTERLPPATFTVAAASPPRGNEHDITVWINLVDAQKMLHKPEMITGIFALECVSPDCPGDRFHDVETEIAARLPGTQVVPYYSRAAIRASARSKAAAMTREAIGRDIAQQERMRKQQETYAALLVPLIVLACIIWLGILAFSNVRARGGEIGLLRALGVRSPQIFLLFLSKAILVGLAGGVLGYVAGVCGCYLWMSATEQPATLAFFQPVLLLVALLGAPLLGALSSLMPALWAARQDPALILQME